MATRLILLCCFALLLLTDVLTPLMKWVEQGEAPGTLIGARKRTIVRH